MLLNESSLQGIILEIVLGELGCKEEEEEGKVGDGIVFLVFQDNFSFVIYVVNQINV